MAKEGGRCPLDFGSDLRKGKTPVQIFEGVDKEEVPKGFRWLTAGLSGQETPGEWALA